MLAQSLLCPASALGNEHLGAASNKRFFSAAFPWLLGRAASPHPLFLRARDADTDTAQRGPWAPGLPGASGDRDSPRQRAQSRGTGCSQWLLQQLILMQIPRRCWPTWAWTGTWQSCHCPELSCQGGDQVPAQQRDLALGLSLPRPTPHWYRTSPLLTAPGQLPLAPPLYSEIAKTPLNASFSGLPSGVVTNCPTSGPAQLPPQCQGWCHQAVAE